MDRFVGRDYHRTSTVVDPGRVASRDRSVGFHKRSQLLKPGQTAVGSRMFVLRYFDGITVPNRYSDRGNFAIEEATLNGLPGSLQPNISHNPSLYDNVNSSIVPFHPKRSQSESCEELQEENYASTLSKYNQIHQRKRS